MTDEQKDLLRQFSKLNGENTHEQQQSIFERMKKAFLGD
jgi:molecular chaperone DnaJ